MHPPEHRVPRLMDAIKPIGSPPLGLDRYLLPNRSPADISWDLGYLAGVEAARRFHQERREEAERARVRAENEAILRKAQLFRFRERLNRIQGTASLLNILN